MALITTNNTWAGKDVNLFISEAFTNALFYKNFKPKLIEAVNCKYIYFALENSFNLQAYECCPDTGFDDVTLDQRTGELCNFMVIAKMCHQDLACTAREMNYKKGMRRQKITDDAVLIDTIVSVAFDQISVQLDDLIINGDTAYTGPGYLSICDGLLAKFALDPSVITVVGTTVDATNVIAELNKLYAAIPDAIKFGSKAGQLKIAVSANIASAYMQALATTGSFFAFNPTLSAPMTYLGIPIVTVTSLPADTMFATFSDNILLVTDDMVDWASMRIIDESLYGTCDQISMKLQARIAIDYGYGKYITLYQ